ncbi:bifunctional 2-methylcitrate synthase/citrate synthase [Amycolatopsis rubida]|uniref:Citrate synthase n=1 Tax=Amycolatopsis rubida TaxID=112413 RepID=A0ABX0BYD0_9PSEU|nr:bifunctional 2-methylcitrate synthase/citrate synthase [Amycolatopsis rubida]MYW94243.1 bifunctional 2-methylcitrate synthase/citrate synthase [Amycolatopsis rubida]NEC59232.1 bifunctional 2-methylcitrate synthase/citrate synthase [Amycolatopsis rubida]
MSAPAIHKGLAGVVVDTTAVSMVNPDTNSLTYRGYPVQDLAAHCGFEEVAYLLWHGELPTPDQLAEQNAVERAHRALPHDLVLTLLALPESAHPMDTLRTAVSILGANDPDEDDNSPAANQAKALRLFAALPTVVALTQRRRRGLLPLTPRDDLGYAENFLYLALGSVPEPAIVRAFETSLVLYAEHSFNASTFTSRVVTSTLSDLYSAVTAAIGALKGPLHGGANEAVMETFEEIGSADNAGKWLKTALAEKRKIMGFGHRVYKKGDSRVPTMRQALQVVAELRDGHRLLERYEALARAMYAEKGLHPNLDYPAGPAYHLMGFDTPVFTPIFVAARITGWTAHITEQLASNSLIRPSSTYSGQAQRAVGRA